MCYDVSFKSSYESISDYLPDLIIDGNLSLDFQDRAHVLAQAFKLYPVVTFEGGKHFLKLFEWGVIADYMNTPEKVKKSRAWMCNARSDKIADKKSYWHRILKNRCLMPVTGVYEHRGIAGWKSKVPYHIRLKKEKMFFLPALYNYSPLVNKETGELLGTFSVVTRSANSIMKKIHNADPDDPRMPLFLPFELAKKWVQPELTDDEIAEIIDYEMPSGKLEAWPVFTIRSPKVRPDHKEKFEPYVWEGLPVLDKE